MRDADGGELVSAEANKEIVRRFIAEVWNAGELAAVEELVHPEYAVEGEPRGPEFVRGNVAWYRTVFPDLDSVIEQMVAEGDWVAVRLTLRGTHLGPLGDIPPSGKRVEMREMVFWRVADRPTTGSDAAPRASPEVLMKLRREIMVEMRRKRRGERAAYASVFWGCGPKSTGERPPTA